MASPTKDSNDTTDDEAVTETDAFDALRAEWDEALAKLNEAEGARDRAQEALNAAQAEVDEAEAERASVKVRMAALFGIEAQTAQSSSSAPKAPRRSRRSNTLVADEEEILGQLRDADDWLARDTITQNLTARTDENHADLRHQVGIVLQNLRNENPKRAETNGKERNAGRWATPEHAAQWGWPKK